MTPVPNYQAIEAQDIAELKDLLGEDAVWERDRLPEEYSHDEMAPVRGWPEVAVFPHSTEQVSRILQYAHRRCIPVTPRGAGTGLMGGATAVCGGILLVTERMNQVLCIDGRNLLAEVQPGVTLLEFQEQVEQQGLFYAPDPGEKSATLGGNVMTNAGGMRAVKHGVTRDHVRGMEVVLADGEILQLGGRVAKNASGYSLMHLMIGSEGTLGIVTRLTLRLLPLPGELITLLVPFDSLRAAIETVPQLTERGIVPQAVEFLRQSILQASEDYLGKSFPHQGAPAYLLIRLEGSSPEELQPAVEAVGDVCLAAGATDVLLADTPERQRVLWEARGAFLEAIKSSDVDECDIVVPRDAVAEMVLFADQVGEEEGLRIESFGHAGDGNVHINMIRGDLDASEWELRVERTMDRLYAKGHELGGLVSGEHGIGYSKKTYLQRHTEPRQLELMRMIKQNFDPRGILNPGKLFVTP